MNQSFQKIMNGINFSKHFAKKKKKKKKKKSKKGHYTNYSWRILSFIELDLYLITNFLYIKFESNTSILSKDKERKPFSKHFVKKKKKKKRNRERARTSVTLGGFTRKSKLTCIFRLYASV